MNITFHEYDLPNGLHLIVHEDHSVPVVAIDIRYHVGSKNEQAGKTGFAHLFEHLMFDGSKNVARGKFDVYLTNIGAKNNAYTTADETNYHEVVPANNVELGLWLESDRMLQFAIKEISLKTQKDVVKEEKRQTDDNRPYGNLDERMRLLAYDGGCYRWPVIGSMEDIDAASLADVKEFYGIFYVPGNATICLAGDITAEDAFRLTTKYFGDIPGGKNKIPPVSFQQPQQDKERRLVLHEDVPTSAAFIAYHVPGEDHDDTPALEILCSILGAGESSRLQHSLIYEKQIASETGAHADTCELGSLVYIYAVAAKPDENPDAIEQILFDHITSIKHNGVTERELEKAKNQKEAGILYGFTTSLGVADALTHAYTLNQKTNSVNTDIDKYMQVSAADVLRVAQKYFERRNCNVIQYIPLNPTGSFSAIEEYEENEEQE